MTTYLGIDVAKATLDVALWVEGKALQSGQFSNDSKGFKQLERWLTKHAKQAVHACLEATGRYSDEVAYFLVEAGYTVSVINPARIKGYAEAQMRRNKTDKLDAALIADFVRTQNRRCGHHLPKNGDICKPWCAIWKIYSTCVSKRSIVLVRLVLVLPSNNICKSM